MILFVCMFIFEEIWMRKYISFVVLCLCGIVCADFDVWADDLSWVKNEEAFAEVKKLCAEQKAKCGAIECEPETVDEFKTMVVEMKNCFHDADKFNERHPVVDEEDVDEAEEQAEQKDADGKGDGADSINAKPMRNVEEAKENADETKTKVQTSQKDDVDGKGDGAEAEKKPGLLSKIKSKFVKTDEEKEVAKQKKEKKKAEKEKKRGNKKAEKDKKKADKKKKTDKKEETKRDCVEFYKDKGDFSKDVPSSFEEFKTLCPEDQQKAKMNATKAMLLDEDKEVPVFSPLQAISKETGHKNLQCKGSGDGKFTVYDCNVGRFRVNEETLDVEKL